MEMQSSSRGRRVVLGGLLPTLLLAVGCNNIFEFTNDDESFDALMAAGHNALREADYETAEAKFTTAAEQRPNHSEARYYLAKAAVLNADIDVLSLVQTLTGDEQDGASVVFDSSIDLANALYRTNATVLAALQPIRDGVAREGAFADADVDLDLGMAYTLRGILRLRDTNGDGVIDANDVSIEDFDLNADEDGDYSLEGLTEIPPDDLNDMIDDLNDLLDDGGEVLDDVLGDVGIDIEDLDELIESLGGGLSAFFVNTGVPGNVGEGDNDGDGLVDEECLNGIDDDGDGVVDEDSRIFGC